jgi:hypothetical protein
MTHDGVHWSRAVNLVFAQEVLHTILQHCRSGGQAAQSINQDVQQ